MRRILVAGNWKMHGSQAMAESLLNGLLAGAESESNVDMAVFPAISIPGAGPVDAGSKLDCLGRPEFEP